MMEQDMHANEIIRAECRQFEIDLADYLEGEPRPEVARHAETCPFCSVVLADLALLRSEARSLPLEDPPARVWANVRAQLAAEGVVREQGSWRRWFSAVNLQHAAAPFGALACLAILSAGLVVPNSSMDRARTAGWLSLKDRDAAAARILKVEDGELADMVSELERDFHDQQASLAPAVKETYLQGLKSLDESISECRASVQEEPGNTLARQYLVAAYTQKAEVLAAALKYDVP